MIAKHNPHSIPLIVNIQAQELIDTAEDYAMEQLCEGMSRLETKDREELIRAELAGVSGEETKIRDDWRSVASNLGSLGSSKWA